MAEINEADTRSETLQAMTTEHFALQAARSATIQEANQRATRFASIADLASAPRRAAAAHGEHEKRTGGQHDANRPDWYAEYMVREQAGRELPS